MSFNRFRRGFTFPPHPAADFIDAKGHAVALAAPA